MRLQVVSLSTEFPNPTEPGKGRFVRARLQAMAEHAQLRVIAPVALFDYANPDKRVFASWQMPRKRMDGSIEVFHPRWLYPPRGGWLNPNFLFARLLAAISRLRRQGRCDVIDAHFGHPEGVTAALLSSATGVPFTVTMRGLELRMRRNSRTRSRMAWALRRANRVIAVSEGLRDLAIELGVDARKTRVIPNGIDVATFHVRDRASCRAAHDVPASQRLMLSAGDLAELKGHHRTIQAVKALRDSGVPVQLRIAGGIGRSGRYAGALRDTVKNLHLEEHVRFVGDVPQNTIAGLMNAADVFCLASSSEGWPNVVNEALACGTPVVATDVGAIRQLLPSRDYGSIVPTGDVEALAGALREALARDWDRATIAEWGGSRSWSQVAQEVLAELREVANER